MAEGGSGLRMQRSDAADLAQLAQGQFTGTAAMGIALIEAGLRALRDTGTALDGSHPDELGRRAREIQGKARP